MKNNKVFMAFGKAIASSEEFVAKRYIGVAPVYVLAVNPTKKEMESIYNTTIEDEPNYLGQAEDKEGNKVDNVRIDFIIKTDANKVGEEVISKLTFFLQKGYRYNGDKTKVQIIDKYGRTAWVTTEQAKNHEIPMYSNGPANIDKDYRPCVIGEEALINVLKTYLGIQNVMKYVNGTWEMKENPEDYEAKLEHIQDYFKGDFSELKGLVALMPENKIKVMFGVRTANDGKQYQTTYSNMVLSNRTTDYSKLDADLQERKSNGAFATTEFSVCDFKEFTVEPTTFEEKKNNDNPFDDWQ
jgi:hypothetical protein